MSFTNLIYHAVFSTKYRRQTITADVERRVYGALYHIMKKYGITAIRIGGMPDHVHLLFAMPPTYSVTEFIMRLKRESSLMIADEGIIRRWEGWQNGYCALTYSRHDVEMITNYIKNQKEHHAKVSFEDELRQWLAENGLTYHE